MLRVAFGQVKTLGVRNKLISKLYQHFRVRDHPYGLQDSLPTLSPSCSQPLGYSAMDPRLDTSGWLTLRKTPLDISPRRGLAPRKIRRAFPGAITTKHLSVVRTARTLDVPPALARTTDKCLLD
jgi:hypothetical protein